MAKSSSNNDLPVRASRRKAKLQGAKVFWFFSSEKNALAFPIYSPPRAWFPSDARKLRCRENVAGPEAAARAARIGSLPTLDAGARLVDGIHPTH
jgi:hypothetical protein